MGLKTTDVGTSFEGAGIKVTDGVYANLKKIEKVRDLSGKNIEHIGKAFDLAIEVQYEGDRFPQTYIGNLKTDASGEVTGWGGAFIVARVFSMAGIEAELDINNRFTAKDLRSLIGCEVYTVSYTAGTYTKDGVKKNNYKDWNIVFDAREDDEEIAGIILEEWHKSRDRGYPKDYTLPLASSGTGANGNLSTANHSTAAKAGVTQDVNMDDVDDDLPF